MECEIALIAADTGGGRVLKVVMIENISSMIKNINNENE
jgi:hypothetical protein